MKVQSKGKYTVDKVVIEFSRADVQAALYEYAKAKGHLSETAKRADCVLDFDFDEERPSLTVRYPNELVVEREYEGVAMIDSPHDMRHFGL